MVNTTVYEVGVVAFTGLPGQALSGAMSLSTSGQACGASSGNRDGPRFESSGILDCWEDHGVYHPEA